MQPTDPNKFTDKAWEAIVQAQDVVRRYKQQDLEAEHLMISLLEQQDGLAAKVFTRAGVETSRLMQRLDELIRRYPKVVSSGEDQLYVGRSLERMLDRADESRQALQDGFISVEHLVLGFVTPARGASGSNEQRLLAVLRSFNLEVTQVETAIKEIRGSQRVTDQNPESRYAALEKYGRDLTEQAKGGKIDPVIGRDEEIRRVVQVLSRRTKNNPVLIGEPGVGKTAIAEGLAHRIIKGDVPESLKNRRLIALDLGSLIAGAKYRGDFEARLRSVLKEVINSDGQVVLFIDELHTVIGTGSTQGAMDAGNLLKPMLARGELRCIGATTLDEYRKYIEKDAALERRFQQVFVDEPSIEDTISILRGLRDRYEVHHNVEITDAALVAAATLSSRYISDRCLPDKAIDLVDEAAAKLKTESTSKPERLDEIDRKVLQLETERLSLQKETDLASRQWLERLEKDLTEFKAEQSTLMRQWESEKKILEQRKAIKEEINQVVTVEIPEAERAYDLNRVAQLRYGKLTKLQHDLEDTEAELVQTQTSGRSLLREQVTDADIAEIVARWTGIPVTRLLESERQKLLQLEKFLHQRVIGQHEAVEAVAAAIRRARSGMKDPSRPIGSFLFMGPTGVGKTELARALAQSLFDSDTALIRLDMSEYMDKSSVTRVIGAPPGYVGYEEGGQLTEAVRRKPYSVVLLDEVEKAHPDVFNILLQVLDDGRITDGQGRTTDFRNAVVVMTSNIGSEYILDVSGDDSRYEEMQTRVMHALRKHFRPEFLNRIDDTILFHPLGRSELSEIVGLQIKRIEALLADQKISLRITPAARNHIAEVGYDPTYGARPLKRAIQRLLQNPIATKILENTFLEGDTILIDLIDGKLDFQKAAPVSGQTAIAS
jgi:ATP-dependent Clp protease ATP-binding subunit ClpB